MKCPKCGKEVNKEDKFCNECGELLVTDVTPAKKEEVK
jgi:rRNA maturation endonuclease Nob1